MRWDLLICCSHLRDVKMQAHILAHVPVLWGLPHQVSRWALFSDPQHDRRLYGGDTILFKMRPRQSLDGALLPGNAWEPDVGLPPIKDMVCHVDPYLPARGLTSQGIIPWSCMNRRQRTWSSGTVPMLPTVNYDVLRKPAEIPCTSKNLLCSMGKLLVSVIT